MVVSRLTTALIGACLFASTDVWAQGAVGAALGAPARARSAAPTVGPTVQPGDEEDDNRPLDPAVEEAARGFGVPLRAPSILAQTIQRAKATTRAAALATEDWRSAAFLGATAADIVRAEQAKGRYTDINPDTAVVVITQDGAINAVYALRPLPPLPGTATGAIVNLGGVAPPDPYVAGSDPDGVRTVSGSFGAGLDSITLRPPYFGSDYSGAPTPQAAAERVGMSL